MFDGQGVFKIKGNSRPRLADVRHVVCEGEGVSPETIKSESRKWEISHPRQIAMWLARKTTAASYPQIARFFGKYDHTTAIYAYRKVERLAAADPKLHERLNRYRDRVNAIAKARFPDEPEVVETLSDDVAEANALLCAGDSSDWTPLPPKPLREDPRAQLRIRRAIDVASWMKLGGEIEAVT